MYEFDNVKYIPGWMDKAGGQLLYTYALKAPAPNLLEIGSFCGRSSCVLAQAVKDRGAGVLTCLDRFQTNVKFKFNYQNQEEEPRIIANTLGTLWNNLRRLELEPFVLTIKGDHDDTQAQLHGKFGFIYVDGGHTTKRALTDCLYAWDHLVPGGYMAVHDYGHPHLPDVKTAIDALLPIWDAKIVDKSDITIIIQKPVNSDKIV